MDANTSPAVLRRSMPLHRHATVTVPVPSDWYAVHARLDPGVPASTGMGLETRTVSVVTAATPSALARIFVLLATLDLVPAATRSAIRERSANRERGAIHLRLSFENVGESRIDLLRRKLFQLTETVRVDATDCLLVR